MKRSRRNCVGRGKTNHSELPFSEPQRRGWSPAGSVCLPVISPPGAGKSLWEHKQIGAKPYFVGRALHSIYHFCGYHSGLEFEEKGHIPGRVSGIK